MGKKATPPRSFNTIRRSQTKVRAQRRRTQNVLLLAMFATVALILIALLVLGGFAIVGAIVDARPAPDNSDNNTPSTGTITFVQTTKSADAVHSGTLILVNKNYKYTFPIGVMMDDLSKEVNSNGETIYEPVPGVELLERETSQALNLMMCEYDKFFIGEKFAISSAYRTEKDQQNLVDAERTDIQPGYSEHHTGYCVAIQFYDSNNNRKNIKFESHSWFYDNAHKYGFVVRYPEDKTNITGVSGYKHCFRYVGVAHATYMYENNLCLEEYLDLLKNSYSSAATRLTISAADGCQYDVYYVAASGADVTTIDVPTSNFTYTVSGDNRGGFIVTVKRPVPAA